MNDYGFMSGKHFKNTAELMLGDSVKDFNAAKDNLSMIQGVNPILLNNKNAYDLAISKPEEFDAKYAMKPLTQREINAANESNISEMTYAPVGQVLYKTKDVGVRLPMDPGYEDFVKAKELRSIANEQVSNAKTPEDLNSILSSNMQPNMRYEYGVDAEYAFAPLTPSRKAELDSKGIDELGNASIADILYRTRDLDTQLHLPNSHGYDEWRKAMDFRDAAINQLNLTNNEADAKAMMGQGINKDQLDEAQCANIGGLVQNDRGEWVGGAEQCMEQKDNSPSLGF